MKKFSLTDSEKKLLLIVLALGMLVCSYFFGFVKMVDAAKLIESSNNQDRATVQQLQSMVDRQAITVKETEDYKTYIESVVKKYPVGLKQEKIFYLVQQMEDIVGVDYSAVSFSLDNVLMAFSGAEVNPIGYYSTISLPFEADYDEFKNLLKYTGDQKDRTTAPNVSAAYDQTSGLLKGAITFRMYYLTNTGKEYEDFPDTGIESGLSNIFHTGEN